MNKAVIALVGMMMLTVALPTNAADAREMNREFLLEELGENFDPEAYYPAVDVVTGEKAVVRGTDAMNMLLDELDVYNVNLVEVQTAAGLGNGAVGTVLTLELGFGSGCDVSAVTGDGNADAYLSNISKAGLGLALGIDPTGALTDVYSYSAFAGLAGSGIGGFCIDFFGIVIYLAAAAVGAHVYDATGAL